MLQLVQDEEMNNARPDAAFWQKLVSSNSRLAQGAGTCELRVLRTMYFLLTVSFPACHQALDGVE